MARIFRRGKKKDGSTYVYPVSTRGNVREYVSKYNSYWELGGRQNALNAMATLQDAVGKQSLDSPYLMGQLNLLHGALLAGINIEGLHELVLENPNFEAMLMKSISAGNGEPISNLYVYDGSKISGIVNTISAVPQQKDQKDGEPKFSVANLTRSARLQFIPISKNIFISLSSRGGFYYRQGNILVPFNRLTMAGLTQQAALLTNPDHLEEAIAKIQNFNKLIADQASDKPIIPGSENRGERTAPGIQPSGGRNPLLLGTDGKTGSDIPASLGLGGDLSDLGIPDVLNSNGGRDRQKQDDKPFTNFKAIFKASDQYLEDPDYRTAQARLFKDIGYPPDTNDSRIAGDVYLYGYTHGVSPSEIFDELNRSNLSRDAPIVSGLQKFSKMGMNAKNRMLSSVIEAFKKANKLKDIPSDPKEFEQLREGDSALSSSVRTLWSQWVDPSNFDEVKKAYTKYEEEEGTADNSFQRG